MAGEVSLTFRIAGTPQVLAAFEQIASTAKSSGAAVTQAASGGTQAAKDQGAALEGASKSALGFRQAGMALAGALSGAAAVASLFARGNKDLQRDLEVLSLTVSGASTVIRTFGAAMKLVALNPMTLIIAGIAALVAGAIWLIRNWDAAKAAAIKIWSSFKDFLVRLWEGIATAGRGLGQILAGVFTLDAAQIRAGWEQLKSGLGSLKNVAVDLGRSVGTIAIAAWEKLTSLFGQKTAPAVKAVSDRVRESIDAVQSAMREELAYADSIEDATQQLQTKIRIMQTAMDALTRMERTTAKTKEEHKLFTDAVGGLRLNLIGVERDLRKAQTAAEALAVSRAWAQIEADLEATREAFSKSLAEQEEERRRLAEETRDLIARANQQALDAEIARQAKALEKTKAMVAEETAVRLAAYQERIDAIEEAAARGEITRSQEIAGLESVMDAIRRQIAELRAFQAAVADLSTEELASFAPLFAAIPQLESLLKALRVRVGEIRAELNTFGGVLKDTFGQWAEYAGGLIGSVRDAFAAFFSDVISGAKSFQKSLSGFFQAIAQAILRTLATLAANAVIAFLLSSMGLGALGFMSWFRMLSFGSMPSVGKQTGGTFVATSPTTLTVGEVAPEMITVRPMAGMDLSNRREIEGLRGRYAQASWYIPGLGNVGPGAAGAPLGPTPAGYTPTGAPVFVTVTLPGPVLFDEISMVKFTRRLTTAISREQARTFVRR